MNLTMDNIKVGDEFKQVKALGTYMFENNTFIVEYVDRDKSAISLSLRSQKTAPNTFFVAKLYLSLEELNMAFEKVKKFIWSDWKTIGKTFSDKKFTYAYKTNKRITFVKINAYDKVFKGKATCHKDDLEVFDETTGVGLAYERAEAKVMNYEKKLYQKATEFKPGDRVQAIHNHSRSLSYIYADALGTVVKNCGDGKLYVNWDEGDAYSCGSGGDRKWYIDSFDVKHIDNTPIKSNFTLEIVGGDILTTPIKYTLLHTIYAESEGNAVGLTKVIIDAFDIKEDLKDELDYLLSVADFYGDSDDLNGDIITYNYKNVVTLVSKRRRHDTVSYDTIKRGLKKLKKHMENNNLHYLAMPAICCGRENLEWEEVKKIIEEVFSDCDIPITVRVYINY